MANDEKKFMCFGSFYEAAKLLPEDERGAFCFALMEYAFDGIEPSFEGASQVAFVLCKPNIDASIKRSKTNSKNRRGNDRRDDRDNDRDDKENDNGNDRENAPSRSGGEGRGVEQEAEVDFSLEKNPPSANASGDAAMAGATPPAALECERCLVPMERTSSHKPNGSVLYRCPLCAEEVWT